MKNQGETPAMYVLPGSFEIYDRSGAKLMLLFPDGQPEFH